MMDRFNDAALPGEWSGKIPDGAVWPLFAAVIDRIIKDYEMLLDEIERVERGDQVISISDSFYFDIHNGFGEYMKQQTNIAKRMTTFQINKNKKAYLHYLAKCEDDLLGWFWNGLLAKAIDEPGQACEWLIETVEEKRNGKSKLPKSKKNKQVLGGA